MAPAIDYRQNAYNINPMNGLTFPNIDPVAFSVGPLQVHWYALAYLTGFLLGWAYATYVLKHWGKASPLSP